MSEFHDPGDHAHGPIPSHGSGSAERGSLRSGLSSLADQPVAAPWDGTSSAHTQSETEDLYGDPSRYAHDWFHQPGDAGCGPAAITQVIEAETGLHLSSYQVVVDEAHHLGIPLNPNPPPGQPGGLVSLTQAQAILQGFEIPSHLTSFHGESAALQAQHALEDALAQGKSVIVTAFAGDLWGAQHDPNSATMLPGVTPPADHVVLVSSINMNVSPPTVTLSDSGVGALPSGTEPLEYGQTTGNEETIPLSAFMDAWSAEVQPPAADSGSTGLYSDTFAQYDMLVTDNSPTGHDLQATHAFESASGTGAPHSPFQHGTGISPGVLLIPAVLLLGGAASIVVASKRNRPETDEPELSRRPTLRPRPA
jgi:hypothetical protein